MNKAIVLPKRQTLAKRRPPLFKTATTRFIKPDTIHKTIL